jgi:general secretion pathway protein C
MMSDMEITAKWSDFSNLDGESLLAIANEKLPRWVTYALVIAIAWQLSQIVWMLVPATSVGDPIIAPPTQESSGTTRTGNQPNVQAIAEAHLFGHARAEDAGPVVAQTDIESLPDARVAFSLKGTVAASDPNLSYAIIADSNKEEKVYKIGDPVQAGTTIHEIHPDLVVLNQNGALSNLKLPKDFPASTPSVRRPTPTVNRASRNNSRSIQTVVTQNVSKLADVIRPTPYFVGGQQQGYRVYPGRDRKQFAALGLRPGDLIKDIDGAALTDPKQAMEIFQNLGNAEQVSVTIERNGSQQSLILKTSQLNLDQNE